MEVRNGNDKNFATAHWGKDGKAKGKGNENLETFDRSQFHKFTLEVNRQSDDWKEQTLKWWIDNKNYHTVKGSDVGDFEEWVTLAHSPVYALLNVAVGGDFPGDPNDKTASGKFQLLLLLPRQLLFHLKEVN